VVIERFSSRREALGDVLTARLAGASRYLRIAGYFRSSLLEVVGEALEAVGQIRVVCNGDLDPYDVKVAKAARDGQEALARTLVSSWQTTEDGLDVLLARERYRRLHDLLGSGRMKVRVVPRDGDNVFVHGKAGLIEHPDGRTYSFVGSVNDSASGFRHAYEILWGDDDAVAADWVRVEFEHFWSQGVDLPDAVVKHLAATASRIEYRSIEAARDAAGAIPTDAVLAERPIYKGGQIPRSWQKRFLQTCVEDHKLHGKARYLIADDVGLGKTLSMAATALVLSLLDDKPVLILAPATLIWQWQEELEDKLGIPAAVWSCQKKCWLDDERRPLTQKGAPELVAKCPWRIGFVSTGLIVNGDDEGERGALAKKTYGVVILDEAHKARASRGMQGRDPPKPNNLLIFLRAVARNSHSVILGTATPIQLDAVELWGLLSALNQGAPQVLGTPFEGGEWAREDSIQFLTGQRAWPLHDTNRWSLFRNPLPPASEHSVFRDIRRDADLQPKEVLGPRFDEIRSDVRGDFMQEFSDLAERHNPIVRRVVRRTRPMLEARNLLKRIGIITHPRTNDGLPTSLFGGEGLVMSVAFIAAHEAAEAFSRLYAARCPGEGFLKTILLRLIGSSARAGLETARHILRRIDTSLVPEDEVGDEGLPTDDAPPDPQEIELLREVEQNLAAVVGGTGADPNKGRIQRIGQVRDDVHILSLRYAGTVEDEVYATLSSRFGDIFSVLGQLPDGFEDQWIDAVLRDRQAVKNFSQRVEKARPPMELRYMRDMADDAGLDWEYTERVLSSRDLDTWMREGW
jgi:hypothetical protein